MNALDDDPVIGRFFDSPEKKAKWISRLRIFYILWIIFVIIGFVFYMLFYFLY